MVEGQLYLRFLSPTPQAMESIQDFHRLPFLNRPTAWGVTNTGAPIKHRFPSLIWIRYSPIPDSSIGPGSILVPPFSRRCAPAVIVDLFRAFFGSVASMLLKALWISTAPFARSRDIEAFFASSGNRKQSRSVLRYSPPNTAPITDHHGQRWTHGREHFGTVSTADGYTRVMAWFTRAVQCIVGFIEVEVYSRLKNPTLAAQLLFRGGCQQPDIIMASPNDSAYSGSPYWGPKRR